MDIYSRRAPNIAINGDLLKSGIPLLNVEGAFKLEAMKPGGRKESVIMILFRRSILRRL